MVRLRAGVTDREAAIQILVHTGEVTSSLLHSVNSSGATIHVAFEVLAYAVAFAVLRRARRRGDMLPASTRWTLVTAAVLGAVVGSKLLHYLTYPSLWSDYAHDPRLLVGGKSIVGGILGGWIAVEAVKARIGVSQRTGDLYVLPLIVGMAIGRVGCFMNGLTDGTSGVATTMPWGIDFGDGVLRHPTQLYEIAFLVVLATILVTREASDAPTGIRFRAFALGYLLFRLIIDGLKPYDTIFGLNAIQWACLVTIILVARDIPPILRSYGLLPRRLTTKEGSR